MTSSAIHSLNKDQLRAFEDILDANSRSEIYSDIALNKLDRNDIDGAIATAAKIQNWVEQGQVFEKILARVSDSNVKEKILDLMPCHDLSLTDQIYKEIAMGKIGKNDFEGAYQITQKMSSWTPMANEVLSAIIEKTPDLDFAQKIGEELPWHSTAQYTTVFDRILSRLDTFLEKDDISGAMEFALSTRDSINKAPLFSKIFKKIEEKGYNEENLKLIESVLDQLEPETQKEMLKTLATQYTLLGNKEAAAKPTEKLEKIAQKEEERRQLVIRVQSATDDFLAMAAITLSGVHGIMIAVQRHYSPLGILGTGALGSLLGLGFSCMAKKIFQPNDLFARSN